jgi:hypothetical protein
MSDSSPILIVERDKSLQLLYQAALTELKLKHKIIFTDTAARVLEFLETSGETPLLIFCNNNLQRVNGTGLKYKINTHANLRLQEIPFFLLSETDGELNEEVVIDLGIRKSYSLTYNYEVIKNMLKDAVTIAHLHEILHH